MDNAFLILPLLGLCGALAVGLVIGHAIGSRQSQPPRHRVSPRWVNLRFR